MNESSPDLERTCCPLCGSEKSILFMEAVDHLCGVPGRFAIDRCQDCRHLFMNPRPTPDTLHLCYPSEYGPHQTPTFAVAASETSEEPKTPWYLRYLPLRSVPGLKAFYRWLTDDRGQPLPAKPVNNSGDSPRALELGCSTGSYLARLAAAGWDVTGVEPGEDASARAREAGFAVQTGTLDQVDLPDETFDAAAAWMVIEHVFDPVETLRQLHNLLKPGGQLLISIPNAGCWEPRVFGSSWYVWELPRHLQYFTVARIRETLERSGFTSVQVTHQRNVLNLPGSLGIVLRKFRWTRSLGERLLRYPDSPRLGIQLALAPLAHLLAWLKQGGRLTVEARRPDQNKSMSKQG